MSRESRVGEKHRLTNIYSSPAGLDTFCPLLVNISMFAHKRTVTSKEAYSVEQHDKLAGWQH